MMLELLSILSGCLWAGVFIQNVPAIARMVGRGSRGNDPLHASIGFLAFALVMFTARPMIFGRHAEVMSGNELAYWTLCYVLSIASASATLSTGRSFGKNP